jgi:hypothetical protein
MSAPRVNSGTAQFHVRSKSGRYVDYANHRLATATLDEKSRAILRSMAAEWLDLAEAALKK